MSAVRTMDLVDGAYTDFCEALPEELRPCARSLAQLLGLAPAGVPWSEVFGHEVTLAAPALVAGAMPGLNRTVVAAAVKAHAFAVIEGFGAERIAGGQVGESTAIVAVLERLGRARDEALRAVVPDGYDRRVSFARADRAKRGAIAAERDLLLSGASATFSQYETISLGKQQLGIPASLALAHAAGWDARRRRALETMLAGVGLGLQMHADVVDWMDDFARGGAWAAALARRALLQGDRRERKTVPPSLRNFVVESGVLGTMLARSRRHYRIANRLATALGAQRLAAWALARERALDALAAAERASPASRHHAPPSWARAPLR